MDWVHPPVVVCFCFFADVSLYHPSVFLLAWLFSGNFWQSGMENLIWKKKKGKHQTATSIDFSMLIQNIFLRWTCRETMFCGYSRSLNLTMENLAYIILMFRQNCTLVMEEKWSETEFIHSGAQMQKLHFLRKKNIIIFIHFGECLPCECTLGRLALGFNYNVMQSPADWTIKQLRKWEWELLQEGFKRQQGHTRICISPTLFIFSWDFSPTTPTDQIRTLVWEKRGRILRGRGGMEKVRMKESRLFTSGVSWTHS